MAGERILITGGSGFIGINLVQRYKDAGVEVLNADTRAPRHTGQRDVWRSVDILDTEAVREIVETFDPTHIVHLAARTDLRGNTLEDYRANHVGTRSVIDAARGRSTLKRLAFASSRLVCKIDYVPTHEEDYFATTPYGQSKVEMEKAIRAAGLDVPWVIFRPTSIWGPWFEVPYRTFFDAVRAGRYVHPRGRRVLKSFGYVGNSVHQIDALLHAPVEAVHGRTLYLGDDPPIEVLDLAGLIRHAFDAPPVRSVPLGVLRVGAKAGDLARRAGMAEPPLTSFRLDNLLTQMVLDVGPLHEISGPSPVALDEAVRRTVSWMRWSESDSSDHGSAPRA